MNNLIKVGTFDKNLNKILGVEYQELDIYRSVGLPTHLINRKHYKCLKYLDYIPDIISNPDYIGINPNEKEPSLEFVKHYKDNVLIGVKLDKTNEYYYVSTIVDIQESKLKRRLYSGRLNSCKIDIENNL